METEAADQVYPIIGYDEKGEPLKEPIGYLSPTDLEVINRSRGVIKDPNGFTIMEENLTVEEFKKIAVVGFEIYQFPVPEMKWVKVVGRIKKIEWIKHKPDIEVYYNDEEKICYVHNIPKKSVKKYYPKQTVPTDKDLLEFQLLQEQYIDFLKENDMEVEIITQGETMNSFRIIDGWSHTGKVDVFSRITEEQRKNIILGRWIGATTWMPAIFTQIKGFLRLGHSVDDRGPLGRGKKTLVDVQGDALKNRKPTQEEEEGGWGNLGNK